MWVIKIYDVNNNNQQLIGIVYYGINLVYFKYFATTVQFTYNLFFMLFSSPISFLFVHPLIQFAVQLHAFYRQFVCTFLRFCHTPFPPGLPVSACGYWQKCCATYTAIGWGRRSHFRREVKVAWKNREEFERKVYILYLSLFLLHCELTEWGDYLKQIYAANRGHIGLLISWWSRRQLDTFPIIQLWYNGAG